MRGWPISQMAECAKRCAEVGDPPCWDIGIKCDPCVECAASVDGSGEAGETEGLDPKGDSAVPAEERGDAQPPTEQQP